MTGPGVSHLALQLLLHESLWQAQPHPLAAPFISATWLICWSDFNVPEICPLRGGLFVSVCGTYLKSISQMSWGIVGAWRIDFDWLQADLGPGGDWSDHKGEEGVRRPTVLEAMVWSTAEKSLCSSWFLIMQCEGCMQSKVSFYGLILTISMCPI